MLPVNSSPNAWPRLTMTSATLWDRDPDHDASRAAAGPNKLDIPNLPKKNWGITAPFSSKSGRRLECMGSPGSRFTVSEGSWAKKQLRATKKGSAVAWADQQAIVRFAHLLFLSVNVTVAKRKAGIGP